MTCGILLVMLIAKLLRETKLLHPTPMFYFIEKKSNKCDIYIKCGNKLLATKYIIDLDLLMEIKGQ